MAFAGAPVLFNSDSDTDRKSYMAKMLAWRDYAYQEAVNTVTQSIEYPRVREYIRLLEGEWWDRRRPKFLSPFYDNKLQYTRQSKLAMLTDVRPVIDVFSRVQDYEKQANIAKGIIQHEWIRSDLDLSLVSVTDAAMLFGNGFWKIGASMPGYMKFSSCGPDMVLPIQPGFHIQDSTAILYRTYKSLNYFQKLWPERSVGLENEAVEIETHGIGGDSFVKPSHIEDITWQNMSPQMRRQVGLRGPGKPTYHGSERYPVIELQEFWVEDQNINESPNEVTIKDPYLTEAQHNYHYKVKPMGRLYPRKRLIVFAGKRLMYDGPSPYWHGMFPFAMLRLNPVLWSFWGMSTYRHLIQINKAINEVVAGTMDAVKRALNPQMITREGGVPKPAWDVFFANMPGGKLRVSPNSNPADTVRYVEPPILPGYVFQILAQYLVPEFDRMSGFLDPNRLMGKRQAPGGETIEQMRDSMNTFTRLESRYMEAFLRDAGYIALSNVFQFYTAKQRLKVLGQDGLVWEDFDYDPGTMVPADAPSSDHFKNFYLEIQQGSMRGDTRDKDKQVAIALARMQLISKKELWRKLEISNADQVGEELAEEMGLMAEAQASQGQGRTPRLSRSQRNGSPV